MAQLGVLTSEFPRSSLSDALDAVSRHGIPAVQFQLGSAVPAIPIQTSLLRGLDVLGEHVNDDLCKEIAEQLADRKITMAAVDGTFNMVHPDKERRGAGLSHLRKLISSCYTLGTSVVTLCTGSMADIMWERVPENDGAEAWAELVTSMKEAARAAEEHGLNLAFNPEVNNIVTSAEKARRIIDDVGSSHIKVLLDPANIFQAGQLPQMSEKLDGAFALVADDIALAHAKDLDHDGEAGHLAAGAPGLYQDVAG
jgi:sugar phosphate isomerase/epimerase